MRNARRALYCLLLGVFLLSQVGTPRCLSVDLDDIEWEASVNEDRNEGTPGNHASVVSGSDEHGAYCGMEWASPQPVDLSLLGFWKIPRRGMDELVVAMSASEPMDVVIGLTVEGEYCSQPWQIARAPYVEVGPEIQCYRIRLQDFATDTGSLCPESLRANALDQDLSLILFPASQSGELRVYSVEFCSQLMGPSSCGFPEVTAVWPVASDQPALRVQGQSALQDDVVLGVVASQQMLGAQGVRGPDLGSLSGGDLLGGFSVPDYSKMFDPPADVVVRFPDPNYFMLFEPPTDAIYYVPGAFAFGNGWAETWAESSVKWRDVFEISCDTDAHYARMWIDRASEARAVIRFRGALVDYAGRIARTDLPSGSPYGSGDWVDEWYYIYPNGVSTRHVVIYTGCAAYASSFWQADSPAGFETQETMIFGLIQGHQPMDDIDIEAVTLAKLDGSYRRISFSDYPREQDLYPGANIQIVNVHNPYKPFTIIPAGNTDIMPYWGPTWDQVYLRSTKLVAWPRVPYIEDDYTTTITHVINRSWYRQTETTLEQIYLLGLSNATREEDRVAELVQLARSWQYAPEAEVIGNGCSFDGYRAEEKAYYLSLNALGGDPLEIRFLASQESPLVDPCLVIHGWTEGVAFQASIAGITLEPGADYYYGFEDLPEGGTALVVWLNATSLTSTEIQISAVP